MSKRFCAVANSAALTAAGFQAANPNQQAEAESEDQQQRAAGVGADPLAVGREHREAALTPPQVRHAHRRQQHAPELLRRKRDRHADDIAEHAVLAQRAATWFVGVVLVIAAIMFMPRAFQTAFSNAAASAAFCAASRHRIASPRIQLTRLTSRSATVTSIPRERPPRRSSR